ncbi:tape measure protein [Sphingomonas panacis]|uniref:tape measure protein n=1 Tax=Sphingomonas panacis TaxID=1560345 RepID=UPI0014712E34|nr:tape measure protein [Sphingomonas panacis]
MDGAQLSKVQNDLYGVAQRYGVELESVGTLYGRLSQGAKELGASQSDLLRFTNGVGAALKIQGGDAAASSGALLQLTQALGGTYVRAEEFNSVNEGARPILQAVANGIDKYKGSVSALRADVIAGTLTSRDFFAGFLKGSAALEQQAAKANLTIGASFTILNNALGKYIGETDSSVGASVRVSQAIVGIANNLEILVPALTAVGAGFAARFVIGPVAAMAGEIALVARALDQEKLVLIGGKVAAAQKAAAVAASAETEVASIEATIAARRADQVALEQSLVLIKAQRADALQAQAAIAANNRIGLGTVGITRSLPDAARANQDLKALITTRRALGATTAELTALEKALAIAQAQSTAATIEANAAANAATLASRAAAGASKLFAGALTLIGGSVAGGAAVLAIGALIAAYMLYRSQAAAVEERNAATAASMKETAEASRALNVNLTVLAATGRAAASGISQAGASATTATGKMLTFAGAVGQAAEKLLQLAKARQREQIVSFATESVAAEHRANQAQARINARNLDYAARKYDPNTVDGGGLSAADQKANADDARIVAENRALQQANYQAAVRAKSVPLAARITENDKNGGFDVQGELAQVTRDLIVARKRGIRSQTDELEAHQYELKQYIKYRGKGGKDDLSPTAAKAAAAADAAKFRDAAAGAQGDRDAKTGRAASNKADRAAAAASRRAKAEVRDAAADERAYSSAERQANNQIAAARADLTNSAVERANIEKDRIEDERRSRENEIAQQAKQGGLGEGPVAETRKLELQRLNNERAALETQVVDAREKQRQADETLAVASAGRANEQELLSKQADLLTSASQRRDLEQRILDIQYAEERAKLEGVVASRDATEAEKKIAIQRLAMLGKLQDADNAALKKKNAGPLDQFRDRLQQATGDTNEALQNVAVDGLENLESGLEGLVSGTETVSSAFKKMASSIIADLARIAIEKAIVSAIGGGSFFGLKLAGGGKVEGRAGGGRISGPGNGTSDSILAMIDGRKPLMVSNGESIVTAQATRDHWPLIDAMNRGRLPRFARGGVVGTPRLPSMAAPSLDAMSGTGSRIQRLAVDVHAKIDASEDFNVTMQNVAVRTVGAAAGPIIAGAKSETIRTLKRPTLPGGWG